MILNGIVNSIRMLGVYEERVVDDDYIEFVFLNEDIEKWFSVFSCMLGPPVKPAGVEPSEANLGITEKSGGIREDQTLFEKDFEDSIVIAKFWPWQDGVHTTLKMARLVK